MQNCSRNQAKSTNQNAAKTATNVYDMALACPVHRGRAPANRLAMAMPSSSETAMNPAHLDPFRHAQSKLKEAPSRRLRRVRSPSIHSSSGRIQLSRNTVCGHAYPHHIRPKMAVKKKSENAMNRSRSTRKMVSAGVNTAPMRWTRRWGTSMRMRG